MKRTIVSVVLCITIILIIMACTIGEERTFYVGAIKKYTMFGIVQNEYRKMLNEINNGEAQVYFSMNQIKTLLTETCIYFNEEYTENEVELPIEAAVIMEYIVKLTCNEIPLQKYTAEVIRAATFPMPTFASEGEYVLSTEQKINLDENYIFEKELTTIDIYFVFDKNVCLSKMMYVFKTVDEKSYYTFVLFLNQNEVSRLARSSGWSTMEQNTGTTKTCKEILWASTTRQVRLSRSMCTTLGETTGK